MDAILGKMRKMLKNAQKTCVFSGDCEIMSKDTTDGRLDDNPVGCFAL